VPRGIRALHGRRLRKYVFRSVEPGIEVDKLAVVAGPERDRVGVRRQGEVLRAAEEGMAPVFREPFSRSGVYVRVPDDPPSGDSSVSVQKVTAPACVEKKPCTIPYISIDR